MTRHDDGFIGQREQFEPHAFEEIGVGSLLCENAAYTAGKERVAGKNGGVEEKGRRTIGMTRRVDHPNRRIVAEWQLIAIDHR